MYAMEFGFCLFWFHPLFSGLFVGASPKIQTRTYRTWPVVDTNLNGQNDNNTSSIILGPLPPGGKTSHGV